MSDHVPEHPRRPIAAPHLPNNSISQLRQPHVPRNEWAPPDDGRSVQARRQSRWVITGMSVALAGLIVAMVRFAATGMEEQRQAERAAYAQVTALPELPDSLASFPPLKKAAASVPETAPYTSLEAPAPIGTSARLYHSDGDPIADFTVGGPEILEEEALRDLYATDLADQYEPLTEDEVAIRVPITVTAHGQRQLQPAGFMASVQAPDGRLWVEDVYASFGPEGYSVTEYLADGESTILRPIFRVPRSDLPQLRLSIWHLDYVASQNNDALYWLLSAGGM